jgi:hypothetical protein
VIGDFKEDGYIFRGNVIFDVNAFILVYTEYVLQFILMTLITFYNKDQLHFYCIKNRPVSYRHYLNPTIMLFINKKPLGEKSRRVRLKI